MKSWGMGAEKMEDEKCLEIGDLVEEINTLEEKPDNWHSYDFRQYMGSAPRQGGRG